MTDEELEQLKRTFFSLEKACGVMYELVMKNSTDLAVLRKRLGQLEERR